MQVTNDPNQLINVYPIPSTISLERSNRSTLESSQNAEAEKEPSEVWAFCLRLWDGLYHCICFLVDMIFCRPLFDGTNGVDQQKFYEQTNLISSKKTLPSGEQVSFLSPNRKGEVFSRLPKSFQKELFIYLRVGSDGDLVQKAVNHSRFAFVFPMFADQFNFKLLLKEVDQMLPALSEVHLDNLDLFNKLSWQNREQIARLIIAGDSTVKEKFALMEERPNRYMRKEGLSKDLKEYKNQLLAHIEIIENALYPDRPEAKKKKVV